MRLIDADALKEKHEKAEGGFYYVGDNRFMKRFEEMPTVDAVPVVRCKDCVACYKKDDYEYWCTALRPAYLVAKDGFCSRGNRVECSNVVCGYCQDGRCYNDHETRVIHVCPRGYGKEKTDE